MLSILLIGVLVIITVILLFTNISMFKSTSNFQTLPTIEEQKIENEEFLEAYDKVKKRQEEQEKNEIPYTWNPNNTLESMKLEPCLTGEGTDRLTCYSAPTWWYPNDAYKQNNFRTPYYGDYFNPIYNYLGNAQELYWDFKSVKDTFNVI